MIVRRVYAGASAFGSKKVMIERAEGLIDASLKLEQVSRNHSFTLNDGLCIRVFFFFLRFSFFFFFFHTTLAS